MTRDIYKIRFTIMEAYLELHGIFYTAALAEIFECNPANVRRWIGVYRERHPNSLRFSREFRENGYVKYRRYRRSYLGRDVDPQAYLEAYSLVCGKDLLDLECFYDE